MAGGHAGDDNATQRPLSLAPREITGDLLTVQHAHPAGIAAEEAAATAAAADASASFGSGTAAE